MIRWRKETKVSLHVFTWDLAWIPGGGGNGYILFPYQVSNTWRSPKQEWNKTARKSGIVRGEY